MIQYINIKNLIHVTSCFFLVLNVSIVSAKEDSRPPLDRYQGAYTGAYLICAMQHKQIFIIEVAKKKGVEIDPDFGKDVDIPRCKKDGLSAMKIEYQNVLPLIATSEGKAALKEHYVHAIMHIKEINPRAKEDEDAYMNRMNSTFRKSNELYVRFEITQP